MGEAATIPGAIERSTSAGNVDGKTPGLQTRPTAPLTNKKNQPSWIASAAAGVTLASNCIIANSASQNSSSNNHQIHQINQNCQIYQNHHILQNCHILQNQQILQNYQIQRLIPELQKTIFTRITRIIRITFLKFFPTQILMQNSHSLLRSNYLYEFRSSIKVFVKCFSPLKS